MSMRAALMPLTESANQHNDRKERRNGGAGFDGRPGEGTPFSPRDCIAAMKNIFKLSAAGFCAAGLLVPLSFVHPFGNPRETSAPSGQVLEGAEIPSRLIDLVERKCGDCHSEQVQWPAYSRVAPFSWLVERDVQAARGHMNLSRWEFYSRTDKIDRLSRVASEARSGEMPPARYTAVHRDSRLTAEEQQSLYEWARAERRRLRTEDQEKEGH
jgi:hypothetical protein